MKVIILYEVINLSWTRSNLTIQLDKAVTAPVFLTCENKKYILDTQEDSVFIPLTNLPNKGMIEEGKWYICIGSTSNTTEFEHISISSHLLESLEDKSRIMKYSSEYCALIIVPSADENLYFYIDANYMMRNTKYKKGFRTAMYSTAREKIKAISTILAVKCLNLAYHFLYFFSLNLIHLTMFLYLFR